MYNVLSSLKGLIKLKSLSIDNHVFRLHYKVTVALLIAFSILVTSKQYIGDPIDCFSGGPVPAKVLDNFCWIHSTFSVRDAWHKRVGSEIPYPGVDKFNPGEERVYHAYYQWVCFVLFFQAVLFYVPRYIWKAAEGSRISSLVMDLSNPVNDEKKRCCSLDALCRYLRENRGFHRGYFTYYFLCEVLNFVNVIGQMYLVDNFLGGEFSTYGSKVFQFTEWYPSVRFDPMIQVFPRLTKCTFHLFGLSGDVQEIDAMCILPINIINEKIYVFMWFWFLILAILSGLMLIYRAVIVLFRPVRFRVLAAHAGLADAKDLHTVFAHCDVGDWFLLTLLSENLDSVAYRLFVRQLREQLEDKKANV
ncbi:innexin inx2-like [Galendromus occidentalis]|uniref:Innexin n=1 Tax=Galendromus occidentalis TaxID=34638 RepID=A0AAJ6QXU4_9ACAR|nr:innexin inx2-like [Galendromus occidentalis]